MEQNRHGLYYIMDEFQLFRWMEYHSLEPFGPKREDLRAGLIASWIINTNIDPNKTEPRTPDSFFKYGDDEDERDKVITKEEWEGNKASMKEVLDRVTKGTKLY